ncbi:SAM-dependent methyltransferase [Amycolatopsis lurida]|uniref:SAM-dependent methyltransferase n=1 Tax=Amycolatopsis lurida TaxID=31959 RepID=UPI00365856E2
MPSHPRRSLSNAAATPGSPQWAVTRAAVRAALCGRGDDPAAVEAAWRIRECMPAFPATIALEHEFRDRVLAEAPGDGFWQYVVVDPDLPPWTPVHEVLPASRRNRVLYLLDDSEAAVRSWIVTTYRDDPAVSWMSSTPGVGACLREAAGNGDIMLDAPIWVVLSSALQHSWEPQVILADLWDILPTGSRVSATHVAPQRPPTTPDSARSPVEAEFSSSLGSPLVLRTATEVLDLFTEPHEWDLRHFSGIEIQAPPAATLPPPTPDTAAELITVVACRPPRTRRLPSDGAGDHAREAGHALDA